MVFGKMKTLAAFCALLLVQNVYSAMTEKQMKAALKLVRNVCQPKSKATDEEINGLRDGKWDVEKNTQCYLNCMLTMYKLQKKDNTFDWEAGIKTLETQAPPSIGEPGIVSVNNCKEAVKTPEDKCTAAYEIAKCVYDDNPGNYFLP